MTYHVPVLARVDAATKIVLGSVEPNSIDHSTLDCSERPGSKTTDFDCDEW
jgi:hypothetical protein